MVNKENFKLYFKEEKITIINVFLLITQDIDKALKNMEYQKLPYYIGYVQIEKKAKMDQNHKQENIEVQIKDDLKEHINLEIGLKNWKKRTFN